MKKLLSLLASAVMMTSLLTGCGGGDTPSASSTSPATSETSTEGKKLLFFAIQNLGDMGINDLGHKAAVKIAEKYDMDLTVVEGTADPSVRTTSILDALETGNYDYCITASWYVQDDILKNMDAYPNTKFVMYDTSPLADFSQYDNVYGISFRQDEGSFLAGVYECLMTKTDTVGAIANQDSPILNDFVTGWLAGVKWFNDTHDKKVDYKLAYLTDATVAGDFETATVLYGSGCDIVYNIAGFLGLGAAQACEDAGGTKNGKYMVGVDYDQWDVYDKSDTEVIGKDNVATSMMKMITDSVTNEMTLVIEGKAKPGNQRYSLGMGGVSLAYNEHYKELTPEDVQKEMAEIEKKIVDGEIVVPSYFDFEDYDQFAAYRDNQKATIEEVLKKK